MLTHRYAYGGREWRLPTRAKGDRQRAERRGGGVAEQQQHIENDEREREKVRGAEPPPAQARQCHHGIRGGDEERGQVGQGRDPPGAAHTHGQGGGTSEIIICYYCMHILYHESYSS